MFFGAVLAGLALAASSGASAGTITVNVPVKLSKLANELKSFRIECTLLHNNKPYDPTKYFEYANTSKTITNNAFDETVPVPIPYSDVAASQITGCHCELFFSDPTPGGFWLQPTPQGTGQPIQQALPGFVYKVDRKLP
jgi:hypothetical protein